MKTNVRRKIAVGFFAIILALLMSNMSVFAEDSIPSVPAAGAHVSKVVKYNRGQTFSLSFAYTATPTVVVVSDNGAGDVVYSQPTGVCPAVTINNIDVVANASTVYNSDGLRVPKEGMTDDELAANTQGKITFGNDAGAAAFPHAGVYAYTITETTGAASGLDGHTTTGTDHMTYDTQTYTMRVYVVNDVNGLAIQGLTFENEDNEKVERADVLFTNTYVEKADALEVKKIAAGTGADMQKQFNFTVTFAEPATISAMPNGDTWDPTKITVSGKDGITVNSSGVATFTLSNNEELTFDNLPAGATYTVQETNLSGTGYTPKGQAIQNGQTGEERVGTRDTNFVSSNCFVGELENKYTLTNTADDITVTGLIINNLPIILLAVLAVAGVFGYRAMRRKMMAR